MPADATVYRNHLNGRKATITTEDEGPKRCWQRIEMLTDDTLTITWRPKYNEACRVASEWVNDIA